MDLTIIVPVYNVETYLPECLDSILQQKEVPKDSEYEVVCIDDGSTDSSGTILEQYKEKNSKIRVVHQENKGLSGARNTGLAIARGEYLWFVDSDDLIHEEAVGKLLCLIKKQKYPDKILFNYLEFPDGELKTYRAKAKESGNYLIFKTGRELEQARQVPRWHIACNYVVKRSLLQTYHLTFVEGIFFEDEEFHFWLSRYTARCLYLDRVFYYYRKRQGSILNTFMEQGFETYINGRLLLAELHRNMLEQYEESAFLKETVSKQELERLILYDVQGVLARLLFKGSVEFMESYLHQMKEKGLYPYPIPWSNLIPCKSMKKTLINWASILFPIEGCLREFMTVRRLIKR